MNGRSIVGCLGLYAYIDQKELQHNDIGNKGKSIKDASEGRQAGNSNNARQKETSIYRVRDMTDIVKYIFKTRNHSFTHSFIPFLTVRF